MKANGPNLKLREYIISQIDLDGYMENPPTDTKNKVRELHKVFMAEVGHWRIAQGATQKTAIQDWLQGLPTACTIEFYNGGVLEVGKQLGLLKEHPTQLQEDAFIESWWRRVAVQLDMLFRKYS